MYFGFLQWSCTDRRTEQMEPPPRWCSMLSRNRSDVLAQFPGNLASFDNNIYLQEIIPELADTEFPVDITLLSLATHTSGLPRDPPSITAMEEDAVQNLDVDALLQPYQRYSEDDLIQFLANYTTPPPPAGSGPAAIEYSNLGAGLLGYALETSLGVSYDQLLEVCVHLKSFVLLGQKHV